MSSDQGITHLVFSPQDIKNLREFILSALGLPIPHAEATSTEPEGVGFIDQDGYRPGPFTGFAFTDSGDYVSLPHTVIIGTGNWEPSDHTNYTI